MKTPAQFGVNAGTLNAMVDAMGAIVMIMARQLNPDQRRAMLADLLRLAESRSASRDTTSETLLLTVGQALSQVLDD